MKYRTSKRVAIQPRPSRSINTLKNQSAHVSLKAKKKGLHEMNYSHFLRDYNDWSVNRVHYAVVNLSPWRSSRYAGPWGRIRKHEMSTIFSVVRGNLRGALLNIEAVLSDVDSQWLISISVARRRYPVATSNLRYCDLKGYWHMIILLIVWINDWT